jgi:3-oxoacyl-[acyl-carrier protein] reductase
MLNSLIQCSALELAPFGVRVNGVAPGITNTGIRISDDFNEQGNNEFLDDMGPRFFLLNKKVLEPTDIANTILFLASEESKFITGEIISVDNGYSLNHDLSFVDEDDE